MLQNDGDPKPTIEPQRMTIALARPGVRGKDAAAQASQPLEGTPDGRMKVDIVDRSRMRLLVSKRIAVNTDYTLFTAVQLIDRAFIRVCNVNSTTCIVKIWHRRSGDTQADKLIYGGQVVQYFNADVINGLAMEVGDYIEVNVDNADKVNITIYGVQIQP